MALQFDFAPDGGVQFSGNFQDLSFGKLLLWVAREKYSGELSLTSPETKPQWLFFKEGQPVGVRGGPGEHYLGWLLVESGKIDEATCMASLQEAAQQKKLQGQILKAMGAIHDTDLQYALRLQLQRKLIRIFTYRQARFVFRSQPHVPVQDVPPGDLYLHPIIGHGLRQVNDIQLLRETLREAETQAFRLKEENHFPAPLEAMPLDEDQINALALLYDWTDVTHFLQTGYLETLPALVLLAIFYVCDFFEIGTKDLIRSKSLSFDDLASPDFAAHPMFAENPSHHTATPYAPTNTATPASMPTSVAKPTTTPASTHPPVATPTAPRPSTYQQASTLRPPNVPSTSTTRPPNVPSTTSTTRPPNVPSTSTMRPSTPNSEPSAHDPAPRSTSTKPLPPTASPATTRPTPQPKTTYSTPAPNTNKQPPQPSNVTTAPTTAPTAPTAKTPVTPAAKTPITPAAKTPTAPAAPAAPPRPTTAPTAPAAPPRPTAPPVSTVAQPPPPARPAPNAASTARSPQANASKTPENPETKTANDSRSAQQSTKVRPSKASEVDVFIDESVLSPEDLELKHIIEAKLQQAADGANFYELLDVGRSADTKDIRESYRQLSRTFHPDRVAGSPLEPLRKKLDSFFAQLNEAHQILSRKTTREDYDRNLKTPRKQVQHVENSVKAEEMYGKATVQIRRKDFKAALEQLKWVRQISPDTGDYEADTFWCEYHLSPQKADVWQETIQKIEKTLEHEAEPDRVHFYIGEIYREQKHNKEAIEAYEKYLAVAPYSQKSDEVRQQLRILQHEIKKQHEAAIAARQKAKEAKESAKKGGWGFGRK